MEKNKVATMIHMSRHGSLNLSIGSADGVAGSGSLRNWSVTTKGIVLKDESQLSMAALRAALAQSEAMLTIALQHGVAKGERINEMEKELEQSRRRPESPDAQWRQEIDRFNARTAAEFDSLRRGCSADTLALEDRREAEAELAARLRSALDGQARAEQALGDALALLDADAPIDGVRDPAASAAAAELRAQLEQARSQITVERGRSAAMGESNEALEKGGAALRLELAEVRDHDAALLADARRSLEKAQHSLPAAQAELEKVHAAAARQAQELSAVRAELAASQRDLAASRRQIGATRVAGTTRAVAASAPRGAAVAPAVVAPLLSDVSVRTGSCSLCDTGFDAWHRGRACSECKQTVCARHFDLIVVPSAETGATGAQTVLCNACVAK